MTERCRRVEDVSSDAISATNLSRRFHKMRYRQEYRSTYRCARFDVGRGRSRYRGRRRKDCYWIKVSGIVGIMMNVRFSLLQIRTHVMHDLRCIVRMPPSSRKSGDDVREGGSSAGQLTGYRTKVRMLTGKNSFSLKKPHGKFHVKGQGRLVQPLA